LAHLEGTQGVAEIARGSTVGWEMLQAWLAYSLEIVRIRVTLFRSNAQLDALDYPQLNLAARCLAHAMATRESMSAQWCGELLLDSLMGRNQVFRQWNAPFEVFITVLFGWSSGKCDPFRTVNATRMGEYAGLFSSWDSSQEFELALLAACDYHCE